ncbi:MAG: hypothetical protein K9M75_03855 [Phycisphaerae bacterium]|nr:hypothetical protein [Phycisphaerae bacterium]
MKRLAFIILTACLCSSCTIDYRYKPDKSTDKSKSSSEDLHLLYPQRAKWVGLISVRTIGPKLADIATPVGFNISPTEVNAALIPKKYTTSLYADSEYYYIMFSAGKRKPSVVRDYGFKVNGRTGKPHLSMKQKPAKLSILKQEQEFQSVKDKLFAKYGGNTEGM